MKLCFFLVLAVLVLLPPSKGVEPFLSDPLNLQRWSGKVGVASDDYVKGSVWPKPQGQSPTAVLFSLLPKSFTFQINGKTSDVLRNAVTRYMNLTFPDYSVTKKDEKLAFMESLEIIVVDEYKPMTIESDESCKCE